MALPLVLEAKVTGAFFSGIHTTEPGKQENPLFNLNYWFFIIRSKQTFSMDIQSQASKIISPKHIHRQEGLRR